MFPLPKILSKIYEKQTPFKAARPGLDLGFTSIESLNFPETSPELLELSLRLANAPAFYNAQNLVKLGED